MPTVPYVDKGPLQLSQAYAKAWDEFNTRVRTRHSIIILYINVSTALLGILIVSSQTVTGALQRSAFYAMPAATLIASLLLLGHDMSMNNLLRYMVYCEVQDPEFPSYHKFNRKDKNWRTSWGYGVLKFRIIQSIIIAIVFLIFCSTAFIVGQGKGLLTQPEHAAIYWFLGGIAILIKLVSAANRYRACHSESSA